MSHDPDVTNVMIEARALRARTIRDALRKLLRLAHAETGKQEGRRPTGAPDTQDGALAS